MPPRLDGTCDDVTHQAGRTYFHGPRRTGDSGVLNGHLGNASYGSGDWLA